jgi:hypothetical protein
MEWWPPFVMGGLLGLTLGTLAGASVMSMIVMQEVREVRRQLTGDAGAP